MMTREEAQNLIPLYVLGLLDKDEATALEQRLAIDSALREMLRHYQDLSDHLVFTVPARPAPDLKDQLRARLRAHQATKPDDENGGQPPNTLRWLSQPRVWGLLAAVLAVALGVLLLLNALSSNPTSPPDPTRTIEQVLANPQAQVFPISPQEGFDSIQGRLVVDPDHQVAVLHLIGVQDLPPEQDYQFWMVRDGIDRFDGGVFDAAGGTRDTLHLVNLPQDFGAYEAAGVTIEPAGGSPGPTGAQVLSVSLQLPEG